MGVVAVDVALQVMTKSWFEQLTTICDGLGLFFSFPAS